MPSPPRRTTGTRPGSRSRPRRSPSPCLTGAGRPSPSDRTRSSTPPRPRRLPGRRSSGGRPRSPGVRLLWPKFSPRKPRGPSSPLRASRRTSSLTLRGAMPLSLWKSSAILKSSRMLTTGTGTPRPTPRSWLTTRPLRPRTLRASSRRSPSVSRSTPTALRRWAGLSRDTGSGTPSPPIRRSRGSSPTSSRTRRRGSSCPLRVSRRTSKTSPRVLLRMWS
mmetsp:Transcript_18531/g.53426  ORF Transcript_18531/g.53426 Transcript_18531/m.53426 type:complete len:220 (+) Transcript_18531:682-1341(+)